MSQAKDKVGKITQQLEQAPPMLDQILDKLAGVNVSFTYSFEKFEIDIPTIQGTNGQQIGRSRITIDLGFKISKELHSSKNNGEK